MRWGAETDIRARRDRERVKEAIEAFYFRIRNSYPHDPARIPRGADAINDSARPT